MHSSRMRTGRSLTVCCCSSRRGGFSFVRGGSPWSGGGGLPGPGGSAWSGGSPWSGGGGLPGPGGGWGSPWSRGEGSLETPPVNRITDTCKNITLATTSLRPVMNERGTQMSLAPSWIRPSPMI